MQCQKIVFHAGSGPFGDFTGHDARCKKTATHDSQTIPEGMPVKVCGTHFKEIERRKALGFHSPSEWFVKVS